MKILIFLFFGGGLGTIARYGLHIMFTRYYALPAFWGTFTINVFGAFLIGFLSGLHHVLLLSNPQRLFLLTGILGGFTTFSTFALEAHQLLIKGSLKSGAIYLVASNLVALGAVSIGYWVGSKIA